MVDLVIRDSTEIDCSSIMALNAVEVEKTSVMDLDKMRLLASVSSYNKVAVVAGEVAAFLFAIRHGADYQKIGRASCRERVLMPV